MRLGVAGVCLDAASYNALTRVIEGVSGASAVGSVDRYLGAEREVGRGLEQAHTKVCVVDYDQNTDEALWITERLRAEFPEVYIFGLSKQSDPERIIAAMRAGCAEYLLKPLQNDRLLDGLSRVEAKQKERVRSKLRGKVVTVIGAKGGTGVTTLALHLALELKALSKKNALLIDQHPSLGDASLYMGAGRHQYSFYELASNTDRLDEELIQGFLLHHDSGLHLLDSPESMDAIHYAPPSAIEQTLGFLAELYEYVVVDCPPGLTDATLACVSQSDQIAIVMTAELPAVRNTARYMERLTGLGYNASSIRVVVNRHMKKSALADDKIEKALQRPISFRIPNSYQEVVRAINAGIPIDTGNKSEFAAAIQHWAREVVGKKNSPNATGATATGKGAIMSLFGK
jgi:pilus assembly protein CpaE